MHVKQGTGTFCRLPAALYLLTSILSLLSSILSLPHPSRHIPLRPDTIHMSPQLPGISVLQRGGEAVRADVVVAGEHREALDRRGNANRRETRMSGGGEGAPVIHGRTDGDAGGHLVVEEPPHAAAQDRRDLVVEAVVAPVAGGIDPSGEVALEYSSQLLQLS